VMPLLVSTCRIIGILNPSISKSGWRYVVRFLLRLARTSQQYFLRSTSCSGLFALGLRRHPRSSRVSRIRFAGYEL